MTAPDGDGPTRLEITTNRGLEELVVQEFTELAAHAGVGPVTGICRPHGLAGWAAVEATASAAVMGEIAGRLRSAHHIVRSLRRFTLDLQGDPLAQIRTELAALNVPELADADASFRVTSQRTGTHSFTSEDVQRVAGAGVRARAWRAVSLKGFDVELRVDVRDERCLIGVQTTRTALSRRHERVYLPHMTLTSNLAWALLQLARPEASSPPRALLDPFCGGGTILLEALARWPALSVYGSDTSAISVEGSRANLRPAPSATLRVGDARALGSVWPGERFDTVVSNPPFGRRIGPNMSYDTLFSGLLAGLLEVTTPAARVALLVNKRGAFNRALRTQPSWTLRHARIVEVGGLHPAIMVLERTG